MKERGGSAPSNVIWNTWTGPPGVPLPMLMVTVEPETLELRICGSSTSSSTCTTPPCNARRIREYQLSDSCNMMNGMQTHVLVHTSDMSINSLFCTIHKHKTSCKYHMVPRGAYRTRKRVPSNDLRLTLSRDQRHLLLTGHNLLLQHLYILGCMYIL